MSIEERPVVSIGSLSDSHSVSENHMAKVVDRLVKLDYLESVRGRNGGVVLGRGSDEITVGKIVRETENNQPVVDRVTAFCPFFPNCKSEGETE